MNAFTLTAKGQFTLRKEFLQHLGVAAGDKVMLEKLPNGTLEIKAAPKKTGKISDLLGILKIENGPVLTIEEMNEIIARGWAGEFGNNS